MNVEDQCQIQVGSQREKREKKTKKKHETNTAAVLVVNGLSILTDICVFMVVSVFVKKKDELANVLYNRSWQCTLMYLPDSMMTQCIHEVADRANNDQCLGKF